MNVLKTNEKKIEELNRHIKKKDREISEKKSEKDKKPSEKQPRSPLGNLRKQENSVSKNTPRQKEILHPELPCLPEVGLLYQANGKAYLAIKYWEDFEKGQVEADRLKATLCAQQS